jgi:purine-binding chemotaxis protein CheW
MTSDTKTSQLVVFALGAEEYALRIEQVHEIIRHTEPRSVACRDETVRGVISLRGRIVPVFDLSVRLGLPKRAECPRSRIVIVDDGSQMAGLMVDSVTEVITVGNDQFADAPVQGSAYIDSIVRVEDRLLALLDPVAVTTTDAARDDDQTQAVA